MIPILVSSQLYVPASRQVTKYCANFPDGVQRGLVIRTAGMTQRPLAWRRTADCKSAKRQISNLRYNGWQYQCTSRDTMA